MTSGAGVFCTCLITGLIILIGDAIMQMERRKMGLTHDHNLPVISPHQHL